MQILTSEQTLFVELTNGLTR